MLDGLRNKHARHESLESCVRGNSQARFGGGPTEKDRHQRYLARGLPDFEGGWMVARPFT